MKTYRLPTPDEEAYVVHMLERQFRNALTTIPCGWDSRQSFDKVLMQLDKQSSPGWPLCLQKPTIGEWLFGADLFPIKSQADKLWNMVQYVFMGQYDHVYKVFVKAEPHTRQKISDNRWRLIMMSSLPIQVAWHMCIGKLADRVLNPYATPLAHGLVYFGGGWKTFFYYIRQHRLNWTADKSGWDWNSPGWVYRVAFKLLQNLVILDEYDERTGLKNNVDRHFDNNENWYQTVRFLFEDAFMRKKVVLPDNTILLQNEAGLMPSGCVGTILINGIAQVALHILALKRMGISPSRCRLMATGDDTIQEMPSDLDKDEYIRQLQFAGCVIKECGEGTDFMGFEITSEGFYPKYFEKHIENLKLQKEEFLAETLEGYLRIYCHDFEMFLFWRSVADRLGFRMPSREYFLYFANHPDALEEFTVARPAFGDRQASMNVVV